MASEIRAIRFPVGLVVMSVVLAGCSSTIPVESSAAQLAPSTSAPGSSQTRSGPGLVVEEYLPGVEASVLVPADNGATPLVVMVPGGGWATADPAGLEGLARDLVGSGVSTAWIEVRAAEDDVVYPVPVEDVLCAVAFAFGIAESNDLEPGPVVVLGHSSGAHLAALSVLAVEDYSPECREAVVRPDALIGLAGPYDVEQIPELAKTLFGAAIEAEPELWAAGNPVRRAPLRPEVPVLLIHGDADELVPVSFTNRFGEALEAGGHEVSVVVVPGADHHEIYTEAVSGEFIAEWVLGLD